MTAEPSEFVPPATGAVLLQRQDEPDALRLLIAQKRMYTRAKLWLSARWFGMLIIGLSAPIIALVWPQSAVAIGSISGAWIFVGRTILLRLQKRSTERAAAVQEQFDFYVYQMSGETPRTHLPSLEDIASTAGRTNILHVAEREKLLGWYVVASDDPGLLAIAIAQRSNAAYSYRLLRVAGLIWSIVASAWAIMLVAICVISGFSLSTFLLGVVLPLLPAFLDVTDYVVGVVRSSSDREALYREIEGRILSTDDPVTAESVRVWQESLFELRRTAPTVPDVIYKMTREKNEDSMAAAAGELSAGAREVPNDDN